MVCTNPSSRKRPRLRPSSVPTNSTDGSAVLSRWPRRKDVLVHAVGNDLGKNGLSRVVLSLTATTPRLVSAVSKLLSVDAKLQHTAPDRRRRPRFAERAAVHHAKHGLSGQRQQQTVAVRDDGIELAVIGNHRQHVAQIPHRHAPADPRVRRRTSTAAPARRRSPRAASGRG